MPDASTTTAPAFRLRTGYRSEPLGLPARRGIMLSWAIDGDVELDRARGATVVVAADTAGLESRDGAWVATAVAGTSVVYDGAPLASRDRRLWTVEVVTTAGDVLRSDPASFEIGLEDDADWSAAWVAPSLQPLRRENWNPVALLRREFDVAADVADARCHVTALGLYRLWINGIDVTADALLRPGWTDYRVRVLHQTYDVGALLAPGRNVVAVELARGWYAGRLGLQREPSFYGEQTALRLQIEADGGTIVGTDESWTHGEGAILASDLLVGEEQDLRREPQGWREVGFAAAWPTVGLLEPGVAPGISPQPHDPVAPYREHEGVLVRAHARGPAVFDFGQNMVGWTRIETRTLPKATLIVRHGETITHDKLVWRDNLRGAFQEDRYTTGDGEFHTLEPRFTMHGFRYAEVWGMAAKDPHGQLELLDDTRATALSIGGGQRPVGLFESSDEALNAVSRSVEWTVRDNAIEVLTDCPQRDERLGWLGDAGVIAQTSAYYLDMAAFLAKFARDAADSQDPDGMVHNYVPPVPPGTVTDGAPGWADGYVRLVHTAAQRYGDLVTAREHLDPILRYLDLVDRSNPDGIRTRRVGADFSDWLSLPEDPDEPPHPGYAYTGARSTSSRRVVASAHTIRSFDQAAELADWLGEADVAARLRSRSEELRAAYIAAYVDTDGRIEGDTQTVYAQAIGYGILRGAARDRAVARLAEKVRDLGHISTGIHGVEHILPVLARNGHAETAASLLLRSEMPSWKHMVAMGGTTIWEKWDGLAADGTMSTAEMNSFNHCALGAVGEFLFEGVAGLDARGVALAGELRVAPVYFDGLDWARAENDTVSGAVRSGWRRDGSRVEHEVALPPTVVARYVVPAGYRLADGDAQELVLAPGVHHIRVERTA